MNLWRARNWTRRVGRAGESASARMLADSGYTVLVRNCRTRRAELDLVAMDGRTLVFVEVKTLYQRYGSRRELSPAGQLRLAQKKRICRGALSYLRMLGNPRVHYRFDLVEVIWRLDGPYMMRHWKNHFTTESLKSGRPVFMDE